VPTEPELLRKVAELEAQLERERSDHTAIAHILELVVRQIPATYWIVDRDLRILRTGGPVEQILGDPVDRFIGKTMQDALALDPGSSGETLGAHERALAGETVQYEGEYRGKWMATVICPYRNEGGEIIGAMGNSVDVTASRALERRMVDAQRAESLGVLAGGLAHDFNNLLVAVLGNADLALREIAAGLPGRNAIENIRIAGLRAAELTDQLLAYAGHGGAGTARVEPLAVVEELVRILAQSIPPSVRVSVDIPSKLALRGDPAQVRQVLLNLFNNACDALRAQGGAISLGARSVHLDGGVDPSDVLTAAAGSYICIDVADTGPGMDRETLRHVFEPFYTTKHGGHGLGLAAVLGIVRAHGGGLRVSASVGHGACFSVLWPTAVSEQFGATAADEDALRTVLVVDDEDLVRDVVARMIRDLGYGAITAADGASALELLDHGQIDAVLVDMTMPNLTGADVIARVRERRPGLPVILCSGFHRDGRGPVLADAYLAKPFRIDALERTLAELLPLRSV
jgi:two-component system, cell cycle sensor histidine kinase and response regulator CckA